MNQELKQLIRQFKEISDKKWIKSISKSFGSIGLTFENELDKLPDALYFPDYYGTELKCTSRFSNYPLFLFTAAFDGPTFPEINRIIEKYGYPDKDFPEKKVLFEKLSCKTKQLVNNQYYFQLKIDYIEEKLYLCVYDLEDNLIEKKSFVYFQTIINHLTLKLNRMALIYASSKNINDIKHFRYYKMTVYELKDKEIFFNLLKKGVIEISLIARISKSGNDKGRHRNKNLVFQIKKDKIEELFKKIYIYDYDKDFEYYYKK